MKRIWLVILIGIFSGVVCFHSESDKKRSSSVGSYWKAERLVEDFSINALQQEKSWETKFVYDIYQSPSGVVREELTFSPPMSVAATGRDVHLYNYSDRTFIAYDKPRKSAVKSRLEAVKSNPFQPQSRPLASIKLLGYECKGAENKILLNDNYIEVRQAWMATEISFKEPLLEIRKVGKPNMQPISISVSVIIELKTVDQLDPSLFKLPDGYNIIE